MHHAIRWSFCVLVALLAAAIIYIRSDHNASVADDTLNSRRSTLNRSELARIIVAAYGNPRTIEKSVRLYDGTYVNIKDAFHSKLRVCREIVTEKYEYSSMFLKWPKELTLNEMDTTRWKVDHGAPLFSSYTLMMIEEIFLSGSVPMRRDVETRVLSLGLGAGYVNSYLHHHFPKMNITVVELDPQIAMISKKWFDLKLDQRQHLIVDDAMNYVKKASSDGEKFDIILLDACTMEGKAQCPLDEAINGKSAEKFSLLLNENGALIANVVIMPGNSFEFGKDVISYYKNVFKYCTLERAPATNFVMTCTNHPRPSGLLDEYVEFMKYEEAIA